MVGRKEFPVLGEQHHVAGVILLLTPTQHRGAVIANVECCEHTVATIKPDSYTTSDIYQRRVCDNTIRQTTNLGERALCSREVYPN